MYDLTMLDHLAALARYNRWMNDKVYAIAATLTEEERKRDLGAFFRSVHGTLNHILLGDRIWLGRFGVGTPPPAKTASDELYASFEELRHERTTTDETLATYIRGLPASSLDALVSYQTGRGPSEHPLWFAVLHLFNHQTHHRGQVTTLLKQLGHDPGVTDLIAMLREESHRRSDKHIVA